MLFYVVAVNPLGRARRCAPAVRGTLDIEPRPYKRLDQSPWTSASRAEME
jgi:hypothetical protein